MQQSKLQKKKELKILIIKILIYKKYFLLNLITNRVQYKSKLCYLNILFVIFIDNFLSVIDAKP